MRGGRLQAPFRPPSIFLQCIRIKKISRMPLCSWLLRLPLDIQPRPLNKEGGAEFDLGDLEQPPFCFIERRIEGVVVGRERTGFRGLVRLVHGTLLFARI